METFWSMVLVAFLALTAQCRIVFDKQLNFQSEFFQKVAFVTGGSSGIGYSIALALARQGAKVVFIARDSNPAWYNGADAAKRINSDLEVIENYGEALFYQADQKNYSQVEAAIMHAHTVYNKVVSYFVNAAGFGGYAGMNIADLKDDWLYGEHDAVFNNLYGVLNLLIAETKYLTKYGDPDHTYSIVNFASYNGLRGCQNCSLYSASKHGILGLTLSTALEFINTKPRIRVNAVAPGLVNTSMTWQQVKFFEYGQMTWEGDYITPASDLWKKWGPMFIQSTFGKKMAEPEEIASTVLFLLSDLASYVNGEIYSVDNAQTAI